MALTLSKYSDNQIRRISFVIMMFVVGLIMILVPSPNAAPRDALQGMLDSISNGVMDAVTTIFGGTYYNAVMVNSTLATSIANVVKTTAYGLIVIHCVVEILQNVNKGADWGEQVMRAAAIMSLSAIVLMNMDNVLNWLGQLGIAIMNDVNAQCTPDIGLVALTLENVTGSSSPGLTKSIVGIVVVFIPFVLMALVRVAAQFAAFSIIIEIGVRRAFAPIALADCVSEGVRSPGFRYFKRYLATYLKMAVCVAICAFATLIATAALDGMLDGSMFDTIGNIFKALFTVVAVNFTAVGMMFKAGEFTNDIVGA